MAGIIIRRRLMAIIGGGQLSIFYLNTPEGTSEPITFEVGMTWAEFCESSYNIVPGYGPFQISSAGTVNIDGYDITNGSTGTIARRNDIIESSGEYGMEGGGSEDEDTGTTNNLAIMGPDSVTGETVQLALIADGNAVDNNGAIWSVDTPETENTYASINQTGLVTILEDADSTSIVVTATYMGVRAQKTIIVTYQSGRSSNTQTQTTTDESGNTSTTTTTITTNGDGSSESNSTTYKYDSNGNVTGSSTNNTTINTNGSSSGRTTYFDETGTETGHTNESVDTSGNSKTQTVEKDENGNDEVTGYVIDTTMNTNGGLVESGIDTGILALDGSGFDIHMVYTITMGEQGNPYKTILSAIQSEGSNKYRGFTMKTYGQYQIGIYSASNASSFSSSGALGFLVGSYLKVPRARTTFTLDFSYRPSDGTSNGGTVNASISPSSTGMGNDSQSTPATTNATNNYIPNQLSSANILVGGCGLSQYDAINMEILEFTATKVK